MIINSPSSFSELFILVLNFMYDFFVNFYPQLLIGAMILMFVGFVLDVFLLKPR